MATPLVPVVPGHSIGPFCLGASIHEVLHLVRDKKAEYPAIDLHYSSNDPLTTPVVVSLSENGLRLRFDGQDQRLRLIEVMDFTKMKLAHKGSELVKTHDNSVGAQSGPGFRRVYTLFGASYPGEYLHSNESTSIGAYILSWNGVAFTFPLDRDAAASAERDHVAVLSSTSAGPATNMAVFEGKSWPEARRGLFVNVPAGPRSSAQSARPKDSLPPEIESAIVQRDRSIELHRRLPDLPVRIILNETTSQDLIAELGPPDVTYRRNEGLIMSDQNTHKRNGSMSRPLSNGRHGGSQPSSYSSTGTDTFDSDFDSGETEEDPAERASREKFWCYFRHGMDILVGPPHDNPNDKEQTVSSPEEASTPVSASPHPVVLKVTIHGNVPGSYAFNRHRRLRWSLKLAPDHSDNTTPLTSEHKFEKDLKPGLVSTFSDAGLNITSEMTTGKVVNRTWAADPNDSGFYITGGGEEEGVEMFEEEEEGGQGSEQWLGNTRLYAFPGLTLEVLENGAVGALTVS